MNFLYFCVFLLLITVSAGINKYNEHENVNDDDKQFRMGKINTLWQKAQKLLKGQRLADLHADLTIQDRKEITLKKAKLDGLDSDGLREAGVQRDFIDIINTYDLDEYFSADQVGSDAPQRLKDYKSRREDELKDDQLKKLWKSANSVGFTDEEMETLREEFSHHQMKLDQLLTLKQEYNQLEERVENSLENLDEQDDVWRNLQKRNREMKVMNMILNEEYRELESKTQDDVKIQPLFEDQRVLQLWSLARKTNMNSFELQTFKGELKLFDHRIGKYKHLQQEVIQSADKLNNNPDHKTEHKVLQEELTLYDSKIKKYHENLKEKIDYRLKHTEL